MIPLFPVYHTHIRLVDVTLHGHPVIDSPVVPYFEGFCAHTIKWFESDHKITKTVYGDGFNIVQRNHKSEKMILHISGAAPNVGPAQLQKVMKGAYQILFHHPGIKVEGQHIGMFCQGIAPSFCCWDLPMPIPPFMQRMARASALKNAATRVTRAAQALDDAKNKLQDARDALDDVLTSDDSTSKEMTQALSDKEKAAAKVAKAEEDLENAKKEKKLAHHDEAAEKERQVNEQRAETSRAERDHAERRAQEHDREMREHLKERDQHRGQARRHERAAYREKNAARNADLKAVDETQKSAEADQRAENHQRASQRHHEQANDEHGEAQKAREEGRHEEADAAEKRRDDHTSQAQEHRNKSQSERKRALEHLENAGDAHARANTHRQKANEASAEAHKSDLRAKHALNKAVTSHRAKEMAEADKASARDRLRKQKFNARKWRKGARERYHKHGDDYKRRDPYGNVGSLASASTVFISLLGHIPFPATVQLMISLDQLLLGWVKALGVTAADILNAYIGFVFDRAIPLGGPVAEWFKGQAKAVLTQLMGDTLRTFCTTDEVEIKVALKGGKHFKASYTAKAEGDGWTQTGKVEAKAEGDLGEGSASYQASRKTGQEHLTHSAKVSAETGSGQIKGEAGGTATQTKDGTWNTKGSVEGSADTPADHASGSYSKDFDSGESEWSTQQYDKNAGEATRSEPSGNTTKTSITRQTPAVDFLGAVTPI